MKLGAQFYSLRERCKTPEDLRETFRRVKEIGYQVVQISGVCDIDAERLRDISDEFQLPITCTHKPMNMIIENTDELIQYHKTINCPVIGLGSMSLEYLSSIEGVRKFIEIMDTPIKKIMDAGMTFAYHNHHLEFNDIGGTDVYTILLEEAPNVHFIHDVYWTKYAGKDYLEYIRIIGEAKRMTNIHFKDMKSAPQGPICPCGEGTIDFAPIVDICKKVGIEYAQVEQDNAPNLGDEFEQMQRSFNNLISLF